MKLTKPRKRENAMSYQIKNSVFAGEEVIRIQNGDSFCEIAPKWGANVVRYICDGVSIINSDEATVKNKGFTGCPVLYPTPNRVKDCKTKYNGKEYTQTKDGKPHMLHGYVYYKEFNVVSTEIGDDFASVTLDIKISDDKEVFSSYPFENRLEVKYTLTENSLKVEHKAENLSENPMPYGFGLHPYFYYNEDALFSIPSDRYVETTDKVIPTRNFPNTPDKFGDINEGILASTVVLDNNLIRRGSEEAVLAFTEEKVKITLKASENFQHFVVYHPKNAKFICIENQTCSIDANNLLLEGYGKYANQIIIDPEKSDSGYIEYVVDKM